MLNRIRRNDEIARNLMPDVVEITLNHDLASPPLTMRCIGQACPQRQGYWAAHLIMTSGPVPRLRARILEAVREDLTQEVGMRVEPIDRSLFMERRQW